MVVLNVVPIAVVAATWQQPWADAVEKTVRIQVIVTLVYLVLAPVAGMMVWPDAQISLAGIVSHWEGEGLWNVIPAVSAAVVTGGALCLRRKVRV